MISLQDQTFQEFILPNQILPKNTCQNKSFLMHVLESRTCSSFPKAAGRKGRANATRNKRCKAILTDTPVKAAL
jgi:hypothetical protein